MGILPKTKNPRIVAYFTIYHTGSWGGVSNTTTRIGNLIDMKGLTEVMILCVSM